MAQSERFGLALRILLLLAEQPEVYHTSSALAEQLGSSPVAVRRLFSTLQGHGLIEGRKGPSGGARLRSKPHSIGLGELYRAVEPHWFRTEDEALDAALSRARRHALRNLDGTTLAIVAKRLRKQSASEVSTHARSTIHPAVSTPEEDSPQ